MSATKDAPVQPLTRSGPRQQPAAPPRPPDCLVDLDQPDGSAIAYVRIDPVILKRLKTRAYTQDLSEFLWQQVFKKALETYVF